MSDSLSFWLGRPLCQRQDRAELEPPTSLSQRQVSIRTRGCSSQGPEDAPPRPGLSGVSPSKQGRMSPAVFALYEKNVMNAPILVLFIFLIINHAVKFWPNLRF